MPVMSVMMTKFVQLKGQFIQKNIYSPSNLYSNWQWKTIRVQNKHWTIWHPSKKTLRHFSQKKNNKTFQTGLGEHSLCLFKILVLISVLQGCYKTFTYRFINTGPRYCIIMDRLQKSSFNPKCSFAHNLLTGMNSCYKCIF